jgi:hypothetical protein
MIRTTRRPYGRRTDHDRGGAMSTISKTTATKAEEGPAFTEHSGELEGSSVSFVALREDMDLTPLLKGLPDDRCQCPHWGYQFSGTQTYTYADREFTVQAGEAFYAAPGHTARASAGAEFLVFSPTDLLRETEAAMARNVQAMQQV